MYCTNCGKEVNKEATYCQHCGAMQKNPENENNQNKNSNKIRKVYKSKEIFVPAFVMFCLILHICFIDTADILKNEKTLYYNTCLIKAIFHTLLAIFCALLMFINEYTKKNF